MDHMRRQWTGAVVVLVAGCVLAGCKSNAELLTTAAAAALAKDYPDADIKKVTEEPEGGLTLFEVDLKTGGRKARILLAPDGTILKAEDTITVQQLTDAAAAALFKATGGGKPREIEREEVRAVVKDGKVVKLDTPRVIYGAWYRKYLFMQKEVKVSPDGKILTGPDD